MNVFAKASAMTTGVLGAAAVAAALILPAHAGAAAAAGGTAGTKAIHSISTSSAGSSNAAGAAQGQPGAAGGSGSSAGTSSGSGSGTGTGSGSGLGAGHGTGTGTGSGTGTGTGSGTGTGGVHDLHLLVPSLPHMIIPVVTVIPSPTGTIGDPGVPCLQGYVWRKAYPGDYVCVTPANRSQAAADDAAALSRVAPGGGPYGKYTCAQGYVWRQVVADDYTCVTPAVRAQASYDNSQANNRVALLSLWASDWTPPAPPSQNNCSGDVCSTTEGGWDGPDFQINGDHFNFGPVILQIRSNSGTILWSTVVGATSYTGFPGAALYAQTPIGDCTGTPGTIDNDYVIALDTVSGRWSNKLPINSDCASF